MTENIQIFPLDPGDKENVRTVSDLHGKLLVDSPVAQLGDIFMRNFYYANLVKSGLINCDLVRYEGRYVAFVAYTRYPFTFMKKGKILYFLPLAISLLLSIALKPSRIKVIFKVMGISKDRQNERDNGKTGEILSFGVLEQYRHCRVGQDNLFISNILFQHAIDYFKKEKFSRILGGIRADNKPSLLFWHSFGAAITEKGQGKDKYCLAVIDI